MDPSAAGTVPARTPPGRGATERARGILVLTATAALAALALWRAGVGADVGDGTHVVALAMRMAQGDQVLVDEMNLQALGSLAAVPFAWVWLHLVGVEGIVLASRVFYLALVLAVGTVAYRALRTGLPALAAWPAVVLMLVPTPYNLLVTSYNTMPVLGLGLAVCTGFAALRTGAARWAAVAGVALGLAVLSHPSSLPAAATLGLTLLLLGRHRPGVVPGLLGGGLTTSALVVLGIALGPGLGALQDTIAYTTDYQADRLSPGARWARAFLRSLDGLLDWRHLPAIALAVLALVPRLGWRWRAVCALGVPVSLAVAAWAVVPASIVSREPFGLLSGAFVLLLVSLLTLPVGVWAHRQGPPEVRLLLVCTLPLALVGVTSFSLVSSAGVTWGVAAPPAQPLAGALTAALVLWARDVGPRALPVLAALLVVASLVAVHPLRTFQNPDPRQLTGRVAAGPLAGLLTDEEYLTADCRLRAVADRWVTPGDGVFFYARSGGYAYSEARMDTNIVWISAFGEANRWTVDWWEEHDRWPEVAVIYPAAVDRAGGWEELAAQDPLIAALDARSGPPVADQGYLVLRADGTTPPSGPSPAGCGGRLQGS